MQTRRAAQQRALEMAHPPAAGSAQPAPSSRPLSHYDAALVAELVADPSKRQGLSRLRHAVQAIQGMFMPASSVRDGPRAHDAWGCQQLRCACFAYVNAP